MTAALASIGVAILVMVAAFTAQLGRLSATKARAQLAADAAALAAVAESTPYGNGRHYFEAEAMARANGAELLDCICGPGATAAQVTVAIDDVVARARAVFDPEAFLPARDVTSGLHPSLASAVDRLTAAARGAVRVVSGFRSSEHQRSLWTRAVARYGSAEAADDWVAPPGRSMHERGLAVDLAGDLDLAARLIADLGLPLHRPLANEPWHFELVGSR